MKRLCFLVICMSIIMGCSTSTSSTKALVDYVDPNIGTAHCRWFFYTPAAIPFGMAKLAPSTDAHLGNPGGWQAVGYDFRHTSIEGFANFHEFQVGGVVFAPTVGELQTVPGAAQTAVAERRLRLYFFNVCKVLPGSSQRVAGFVVQTQIDEVVGQQLADEKFGADIIELTAGHRLHTVSTLAPDKFQQGKIQFLIRAGRKRFAGKAL